MATRAELLAFVRRDWAAGEREGDRWSRDHALVDSAALLARSDALREHALAVGASFTSRVDDLEAHIRVAKVLWNAAGARGR
jgi:hypothetical protein